MKPRSPAALVSSGIWSGSSGGRDMRPSSPAAACLELDGRPSGPPTPLGSPPAGELVALAERLVTEGSAALEGPELPEGMLVRSTILAVVNWTVFWVYQVTAGCTALAAVREPIAKFRPSCPLVATSM